MKVKVDYGFFGLGGGVTITEDSLEERAVKDKIKKEKAFREKGFKKPENFSKIEKNIVNKWNYYAYGNESLFDSTVLEKGEKYLHALSENQIKETFGSSPEKMISLLSQGSDSYVKDIINLLPLNTSDDVIIHKKEGRYAKATVERFNAHPLDIFEDLKKPDFSNYLDRLFIKTFIPFIKGISEIESLNLKFKNKGLNTFEDDFVYLLKEYNAKGIKYKSLLCNAKISNVISGFKEFELNKKFQSEKDYKLVNKVGSFKDIDVYLIPEIKDDEIFFIKEKGELISDFLQEHRDGSFELIHPFCTDCFSGSTFILGILLPFCTQMRLSENDHTITSFVDYKLTDKTGIEKVKIVFESR